MQFSCCTVFLRCLRGLEMIEKLIMISLDYFSCSKWLMCLFMQYPMDFEATCLGCSCAEGEQF